MLEAGAEETEETTLATQTAVTDSDSDSEELHALSEQAQKGTEGNLTMRLKGKVQKYEVIVLIDSGSSTSFISVAVKLKGAQPLNKRLRVKIADGKVLEDTKFFPQCKWSCQASKFCTDFKVLPLDCYDVIIGMDWLDANSPMRVDWVQKWMVCWDS
jgi:hypothetical protein